MAFSETRPKSAGCVLGIMKNNEIKINDVLDSDEAVRVHGKLIEASETGYDSCVITSEGIYATKKLKPLEF